MALYPQSRLFIMASYNVFTSVEISVDQKMVGSYFIPTIYLGAYLPVETRNFQDKSGNSTGNFNKTTSNKNQCCHGEHRETAKETDRKQVAETQETYAPKNTFNSFLTGKGTANIIDQFFCVLTASSCDLTSP